MWGSDCQDKDLAYWATPPIADVRRGRAQVETELESVGHEGRTFWHAPGGPPEGAVTPGAHLLQVLDARGVVPRSRGPAVGRVLVDGQMVTGMKRSVGASSVTVTLTPFAPLWRAERRAVDEAAERYPHAVAIALADETMPEGWRCQLAR